MPARMPTLAAMRRSCPDDVTKEGAIRLLFIRDGGRIGLVQTASETADNADQFLAGYLGGMITDVAAPFVVVTVSRADGRPTHSDRQLWSLLLDRLAPTTTTILDLVALGPTRAWSARRARQINPPRRRRASRANQQSASRANQQSDSRADQQSASRASQQSAARRSASRATAR
jgi:hypothetical protein